MTEKTVNNSASACGEAALRGLMESFGLSDAFALFLASDKNSAELKRSAKALQHAADMIGRYISEKPEIVTQFALYNLTRSSPGIIAQMGDQQGDRSLNKIVESIREMKDLIWRIAEAGVSTNIADVLREIFLRERPNVAKKENLGYALLFQLGLARAHKCTFRHDHVLNTLPRINQLFHRPLDALQRKGVTCADIVSEVRAAVAASTRSLNSPQYLGGLLEAGITDHRELWRPLFQQSAPDADTLDQR